MYNLNLLFNPNTGTAKVETSNEFKLVGVCHRCGKCCDRKHVGPTYFRDNNCKCIKLSYHNIDGLEMAHCDIHREKPQCCFLWPYDPYENDIPEGCGFSWEEIE